eukprot:TRINITY_DN2239_c0_g1_i6.p1 TRINITY_DN2239_c0_g1~~TRINITY_DN2239_c0_g1_i6.p1  ORF type:complete len:208 (+),score=1.23 TRINITY_DN2239_c0_g1_i6:862-1485(+)
MGRVSRAVAVLMACGVCCVRGQVTQAGTGSIMGGTICDTMTLNTGKGFVYGNVQGYGLTTFDVTQVQSSIVEVDNDAGTFTDVVDDANGYLYTTSIPSLHHSSRCTTQQSPSRQLFGITSLSSGADLDVFSGYVYVSTTAQQWGRSSSSTCLTPHRRRRSGQRFVPRLLGHTTIPQPPLYRLQEGLCCLSGSNTSKPCQTSNRQKNP